MPLADSLQRFGGAVWPEDRMARALEQTGKIVQRM
jgi:hypothetical protein